MTFGERLKMEREARGVGLAEVAAATKINRRLLEALEHDDFETLPGDVFAKGYVRAVAGFIGADAEALVAEFVHQRAREIEPAADGAGDPFLQAMSRVLKVGERTTIGRMSSRQRAIVVAIGLAGGTIAVAAVAWISFGMFLDVDDVETEPVRIVEIPAATPKPERNLLLPTVQTPEPTETLRPAVQPKEIQDPPPAPPPEPEPPPTVVAQPEPEPEPVFDSRAVVSEQGVGADIVNHRLVGVADQFPVGSAVWFWIRVVRGDPGEKIFHVWTHEGREVSKVELELGSGNWRTQSRIWLPLGLIGGWTVEARDRNGRVLAREAFVSTSN
jgi:cytoskeletal protein RodZ